MERAGCAGVGEGRALRVRSSSMVVGNCFPGVLGAGVDLLTKNRFGRRPSPAPVAQGPGDLSRPHPHPRREGLGERGGGGGGLWPRREGGGGWGAGGREWKVEEEGEGRRRGREGDGKLKTGRVEAPPNPNLVPETH